MKKEGTPPEVRPAKRVRVYREAKVTRVVWSGDGVSICATESLDRPRRGVDFCGYRCPVDGHVCTADRPCHDCM